MQLLDAVDNRLALSRPSRYKSENSNASKTEIYPWRTIRNNERGKVSVDLSPNLNDGNTTSAV
jgi:hypothetical protein